MNSKTLAIIVLLATLTFALSPVLTPGFAGFAPDQFPIPQMDPAVQPAGYAFSIWGIIYIWLIAGAIFGIWKAPDDPDWHAMRIPLSVSLIIGTFWVAVANIAPLWATGMIVVMAVTAILAMLRAGHDSPVFQVRPVALYAGWLTAATAVAIGVTLGGYGILSEQSAAILCLLGVLIIALAVQTMRPGEWGYPAAVVWALIGVIVNNSSDANWPVIILATLGAVILTLRTTRSIMKETVR